MSMYPGTGEHCSVCGKVYLYIGDVPSGGFNTGEEPWCTCTVPDPGLKHPMYMYSTDQPIMHTTWCVTCYLHDNKKVPAEFILHGDSKCEKCMPGDKE